MRFVGLIDQRLGRGVRLRQVPAHAHKLGPLPGKQQCSLRHGKKLAAGKGSVEAEPRRLLR